MALQEVARRNGQAHRLELTFGRNSSDVRLIGEIDLVAAPDAARLFANLDRLDVAIQVDLSGVTFLDSSGVQPLVRATRHRRDAGMPPLLIGDCSRPARRLLDFTTLVGQPLLDVDAWDELCQRFQEGRRGSLADGNDPGS